jgi:amidophosphoribosyltransferase
VRYPTAGNAYSEEEAQPFYVNAPFGITLAHNGNLTNAQALKAELFSADHRHINTESDTEVLVNVLRARTGAHHARLPLTPQDVFAAVAQRAPAHPRLLCGGGADRRPRLLAFRDPYGIRPLCMGRARRHRDGRQRIGDAGRHGHTFERNVAPGEAVFIDLAGKVHAQQCADSPKLFPCIFEYVYLRRPGFGARRHLGLPGPPEPRRDAGQARRFHRCRPAQIDVIIPIPNPAGPAPRNSAHLLGVPYREGFVKNRYVGRTFIMPGRACARSPCARSST